MSENSFEIAFSGALAPGADAAQVKKNMAALFKTELAKVEPLFSGKRFVLKKALDQVTALKYQKALREAGALVEVVNTAAPAAVQQPASQASPRPAAAVAPPPRQSPAAAVPVAGPAAPRPAATAAGAAQPGVGGLAGVTVDPPGVVLITPEVVPPLQVDLGHLTLDRPGVVLVPPSDVPDLQVDLAGMSMAQPGALLKEPEPVPDLMVDTAAMTMAAPGVTLVEPEPIKPPVIDISRIQLV